VTTETELTPATKRAILLLSFATFSSMCTQRVCDPMLPELSRVFDAPMGQAAHVVSYFAITYGLMQLFYGPVGDRFGKYRVVIAATLGCSLGCALAALSSDLSFLVLARVVTAMAAAAIIPMSLAWVGDAVSYKVRQETLARVGLGTMLGMAGGQLFGGWMSDTLGWRWAFGILSVQFSVVCLLLLQHWRRIRQPVAPAYAQGNFVQQLVMVSKNSWARVLLSIALLEGLIVFGVTAISATHLHVMHGLSLTLSGSIAALFGMGGMLYMATAKYTIRRFGEVGLARWGGLIMGTCFAVLALTPWWPLAAPASLMAGFSFAMFHNTMQANATQMVPSARATGVTLFAGFLFWGQSVGVWMLAYGMQVVSTRTLISVMAVCMVLLGWYFGHAIQHHRHATHADPA
jgi:YNFM family putative membrane transporter